MKKAALLFAGLLASALIAAPWLRPTEQRPLSLDEASSFVTGERIALSQGFTHAQSLGPPDPEVSTVLLVHGFSTPLQVWDNTAPALVEAGFRVIRYDLYGRGWSDRPQADHNLAFFHQQIDELLAAYEIEPPIHLVGLSMGGAISASYAAQNPDRIKKLVLIAPFNKARSVFGLDSRWLGEYFVRNVFVPLMPLGQDRNFADPALWHKENPNWKSSLKPQAQYLGFSHALWSSLREIISKDQITHFQTLGTNKQASLLIWGRQDLVLPYAEHARVRGALGTREFLTVNDGGHLPHLERPEVVNPRLIDFLKK